MVKIPTFNTTEEEAKYWDTHSIVGHEDELEPVEVVVKEPLSHSISVRLTASDLRKLRNVSQENGVGTTTMARMLLHRALHQQERPQHTATEALYQSVSSQANAELVWGPLRDAVNAMYEQLNNDEVLKVLDRIAGDVQETTPRSARPDVSGRQ